MSLFFLQCIVVLLLSAIGITFFIIDKRRKDRAFDKLTEAKQAEKKAELENIDFAVAKELKAEKNHVVKMCKINPICLQIKSGEFITIPCGSKFDIDKILFKAKRTGDITDTIIFKINSTKSIIFWLVHAKILLSCIFDNTYYIDAMRLFLDERETIEAIFDVQKYDVFLSGTRITRI